MSTELARIGGALGALGLALLLVAPRRDLRIAGLLGWLSGCGALAAYLAPSGHHRVLAAAVFIGAVAAALGAWLSLRLPWTVALATLACVPARIPVHVGSTEANLLLPLYGVVVAGALALGWQLFGDDARARELGPLALPLGLFVAWDGVSLLWTEDPRQGAIELLFFVLPFGLLAVVLARLPWSKTWLVSLYVQLAAMAVVFAAIGVEQYETRNIIFNPKVKVDNAYAPVGWFYRVNSVFYDPSIYGRFLVIAILASLVVVLRRGDPLWAIAAGLAIVVTWLGLAPSFSQSSFAALLVGASLAAVLAWRWRSLFLVAAAVCALVIAGVASPQVRHRVEGKSKTSVSNLTSGRSTLVSTGAHVAVDHPIAGVGVGGFRKAYAARAHLRGKNPKAAASHTTPITVAAELGVVGFVLFAWLVAAALWLSLRRLGSGFTGGARLACGLALAAILVHSLFYNALFEDPTFWGLLALAAVAARAEHPSNTVLQASNGAPKRPERPSNTVLQGSEGAA